MIRLFFSFTEWQHFDAMSFDSTDQFHCNTTRKFFCHAICKGIPCVSLPIAIKFPCVQKMAATYPDIRRKPNAMQYALWLVADKTFLQDALWLANRRMTHGRNGIPAWPCWLTATADWPIRGLLFWALFWQSAPQTCQRSLWVICFDDRQKYAKMFELEKCIYNNS